MTKGMKPLVLLIKKKKFYNRNLPRLSLAQTKLTVSWQVVLQQVGDPFRSLVQEDLHQIHFLFSTSCKYTRH